MVRSRGFPTIHLQRRFFFLVFVLALEVAELEGLRWRNSGGGRFSLPLTETRPVGSARSWLLVVVILDAVSLSILIVVLYIEVASAKP